MNTTLKIILFALIGALFVVAAGALSATVGLNRFAVSGRIAGNVTVGGVSVGGMPEQEAATAIAAKLQPTMTREIELSFPDGKLTLTREELGLRLAVDASVKQAMQVGRTGGTIERLRSLIRLRNRRLDIPVKMTVDADKVQEAVEALRGRIDRPAVNAEVSVSGQDVSVRPGRDGRKLGTQASVQKLVKALADPATSAVALVVERAKPDVTADQLQYLETVLGSFDTRYNGAQTARSHNLGLAAAKINKTVIAPGQRFSFNDIVGERTEARGYKSAPTFADGDIVPGIGGGMCQISTTIYNAALLAGLDCYERYHHQRPVHYVSMGRDATVDYSSKDFKFRNNLSHAILILASAEDGHVGVRIIGAASDKVEVKLTLTGVTRGTFKTVEVRDPTLPAGKRKLDHSGSAGGTATLWRQISKDGSLVKKERLHSDQYPSIPKSVLVGAGKPIPPIPPATPAPKPAAQAPEFGGATPQRVAP